MLNGKQKKALAALMRTSTNRDAARLAGVSESTLQRYLTMPEFKAEYTRLSNELLNDALINAQRDAENVRIQEDSRMEEDVQMDSRREEDVQIHKSCQR